MAGPKQNRTLGYVYAGAAIALGAVTGIIALVWGQTADGLETVLIPVFIGVLGAPIFGLYWRAKQHLQSDADTAMAEDPRPPVIYLRSFEDDQANAVEWSLKEIMDEEVGPFVAVGRPGDTLPPFGGASRAYLPDDEWKTYVRGILDRAALIILRAGKTRGLQWELGQCFQRVPPERVIVLVPDDESAAEVFSDLARKANVGVSFPVIPERSARRHRAQDICGLVFFDSGWRGVFVPFEGATWKGSSTEIATSGSRAKERLKSALAPLSKQMGLDIAPPKTNTVAIIVWSWLGLTAIICAVLIWLAATGVLK